MTLPASRKFSQIVVQHDPNHWTLAAHTAAILQHLIDSGAEPPAEEQVACSVAGGFRVVVSVTRDDGPLLASPALRKRLDELTGRRDVEECILAAAGLDPVTVKRLARLAGYSYTRWFRDAVNKLIAEGRLLRLSGGVKAVRVTDVTR